MTLSMVSKVKLGRISNLPELLNLKLRKNVQVSTMKHVKSRVLLTSLPYLNHGKKWITKATRMIFRSHKIFSIYIRAEKKVKKL